MEQLIMIGEKSMPEQPILINRLQHVHLPLWKRLTVVTTLLLSAGALAPVACFAHAGAHTGLGLHLHLHHHHRDRYIGYATCVAGDGGDGGIAINGSAGGNAAGGGDCMYNSAKGGPAGEQGAGSTGASGGNVIFAH
jgi:hypothetical protein